MLAALDEAQQIVDRRALSSASMAGTKAEGVRSGGGRAEAAAK